MKKQICFLTFLVIFTMVGCGKSINNNEDYTVPYQITKTPFSKTQPSSSTPVFNTPTLIFPASTQQTVENLSTLRQPSNCLAPCFLGIVPEVTRISEIQNIFTKLGLPVTNAVQDEWNFWGTNFQTSNGILVLISVPTRKGVASSTNLYINLQSAQLNNRRDWETFSPESLIKQYGIPSKVEFWGNSGEQPYYFMTMHFDNIATIVEYSYGKTNQSYKVCPLSDEFWEVRLWFGENPLYPPYDGIPLEQATTMTISEFSELLLGNSEDTCFNLNSHVFQ